MTLNKIIENYGIEKINTLTKYPSILTYHEYGEKGVLQKNFSEGKTFTEYEECYVTEKIDGTNTRIIIYGNDFIIGSREQLLYAKNDRFFDPAQSIVITTKQTAYELNEYIKDAKLFHVVFGETYGGTVSANSKNYTDDKSLSFRIFDVLTFTEDELVKTLKNDIRIISEEREKGSFHFETDDKIKLISDSTKVKTVEYLMKINTVEIPETLSDTYNWLQNFKKTKSGINFQGNAEGVILRTENRALIRKLRFEDYERTKNKQGF